MYREWAQKENNKVVKQFWLFSGSFPSHLSSVRFGISMACWETAKLDFCFLLHVFLIRAKGEEQRHNFFATLVKAFSVNCKSLGRSLKYILVLCVILLFFHNYIMCNSEAVSFHPLLEYVPWYVKVVKENFVVYQR